MKNIETKTEVQESCESGHRFVLHSGIKHTLGNTFVPGYHSYRSEVDNNCIHMKAVAYIADFMKTAAYAYLAYSFIS